MTKKLTSEDCEGNIEDIEDGRYNSHVVPVSAEDDPGYEDIDYGDCTEFTVPLGRYGSHVVPIAGGGGNGSFMKACDTGGLEVVGTGDGACMQIKTEADSALVIDGGVLKIDSTKIKVTADNVLPAGTDPGLVSNVPVFTDPDGNSWDNQSDYNVWLYEEQKRQDEDLENLDLSEYVTLNEFNKDQQRQDLAFGVDQQKQNEKWEEDQKRQDDELEAIQDQIDFCKIDGLFQVRSQIEFSSTVCFGGSHIDIAVNYELEVGDKLHCVSTGFGDEESYTVTAVSDVLDAPGGLFVTDYRRYSLAESVTVPWIQKGQVQLTSCVYPYVTPEEFAEDQQRQDEEFAVDQKRQDEALEEEIRVRKARDLLHDAEIDTIEYKLDALLGLTFQGTYEFKHDQTCEEEYQECMANCTNDARCEQDCVRAYSLCEANNVDPGFFEAIDPDGQFDHLQEIIISKNDKSNVEIDWAGVLDKDDYLEVDHVFQGQLDKTNYGLYRIMEEPEMKTNSQGEVVYVMKLQFLQGDGVLNEKELYEIRGITAAEGVNPEELGDFLTKEDASKLYASKTHTHDNFVRTDTDASQSVSGNLSVKYVYGLSSGQSNGFVTRAGIEDMIADGGGGGDPGNDYIHSKNSQNIKIYKSGNLYYIE